jgi:hypothetical protein|tara:strand:+ start:30 stop:293 length:264 start_codon:yes stop_codon:yes gene_type:complete
MEYFIMNEQQKHDFAFQIIERAYFSVQSALTDDPDEEIYYENMPERATEELMQLQKYVCKTLDVKPEDFSSIGSDDVFIYSVEPFLS